MKLKHLFLALLLLGISSTIFASSALFAQDTTVLTVALPDWMESSLEEEMFDEFEANHPGVSVVFNSVSSDLAYPIPAEYDIEAYLDGLEEYARSGDLLFVTNYNFTPAATRAGYFLDITPLVSTDFELDTNDFYPAMWQSFQWDQGMWGLPISASFNVFVYRKEAFYEAGVPYPTPDWTFADFADAVRALSQFDEEGDLTLPGFVSFGPNYVLRSFLSQGFYDSSTLPESPMFTDPELVDMLTQWYELDQEGVFGTLDGDQNWDFNEVPLTVQQPFNLMFGTEPNEFGGALLPGGIAGMEVNGVALSAGTENPELAYELAQYITSNIEIVAMLFGMSPARQSLVGVEAEGNVGQLDIPEDVQGLIDQAALGALPISEVRFAGYVDQALNTMRADGVDAATALQQMEEQAIQDLQAAEARRDTTTIFVSTPAPTPVLSDNEIALRFNLNLFTSSLPDEEGWDQFLADFAAEDPQVGFVELDMSFDTLATIAEENDCFYMPYNAISGTNTTLVLSIDPFLSADFNFDANDMAPGIMAQLQRDGMTYGLPLTLQPQVLWYNSARFEEAGAFPPENGWTIDEFEDALRALRASSEDDDTPPFTGSFNAGYILMLIASYGGMPVDTIANPPIVNLIDPINVEAIRQVLDLAREGFIDYSELGNFSGGGGNFSQSAIYDETLSSFSFQFQVAPGDENPYRLTTYPSGTQYTPVSYGIGSGYISATAQNPDACYRFLSALAQRPDLLGGVPARLSLIDDPAYAASQSPDALNFYRSYFETLADPNLVVLPGNFGSGDQFPGLFVLQLWLYRAFDAYVLEDGDLDAELQQAQMFSEAYLECTADIPPFDESLQTTQEEQIEYFTQFARCAVLVDPETESLFGGLLAEED